MDFPKKSQEEEGRPSSKRIEFYDGVYLFDEADRDRALRDIQLLLNDEGTVLKNGRHPKLLKRFEPIGECCETSCDFITWLEKALERCTFVLVYCSKQFFSSSFKTQIQSHIMLHSFEADGCVYDKIGNQFNVIPVRPANEERIMKMPFTQIGFVMSDFENEKYRDEFRIRFVKTFNARLYIREERENREMERLRLTKITSTEAVGQLSDCVAEGDQKGFSEESDCVVEAGSESVKAKSSIPCLSEAPNGVIPTVARSVSSSSSSSYSSINRKKKRPERINDPSFKHLP